MLVLACLGQGRESVSKQHFLVVVPQPVGFWRSEPLVHFPTLNMSLLTQHFLAKCSFHSSVGSLNVVMLKRKTDQNRIPSHQWKDSKTHTVAWLSERNTSDKCTSVVNSSLTVHHNMVVQCRLKLILCCLCRQVWWGGCMFCSLVCYHNMCIAIKVLSLHLKSDFITLLSSEGLAALFTWL